MNVLRSLQLAASAPVARERLQILLEYERKLDDRFHESCHFGGFIPAVWIPI